MISLKLFVDAIHDAILGASESLMKRNLDLLDQYFEKGPEGDNTLVPKSVTLEFHSLTQDGAAHPNKIRVPLITLVPIALSRIERATITTDFEIKMDKGELQLDFSRSSGGVSKLLTGEPKVGRLEIVMTPQETPEGLKVVVDAYELTLKRQLS